MQNMHIVELFFTKLCFNLKAEASRTYLSYSWWLLEPAITTAVFYIVFGIFFINNSEKFLAFILCGNIPFLWFSKSVANSTNSLIDNKSLINQVAIPKAFFPLLIVFQDSVKQCVVFLFFFTFLILYGLEPNITWLAIIPVIITQFCLIIAAAMLASTVTPFVPDFRYLVDTALTLMMFSSGIFFDYRVVITEPYQSLFLLNPMATLIANYRSVLLENSLPNWGHLFMIMSLSSALIIVLHSYFKKMDTIYALKVNQ